MYALLMAITLSIAYGLLFLLFSFFFNGKIFLPTVRSYGSIVIIAVLEILIFLIAYSIADPAWSNRFLHAIGGGFASFVVCFLVVRDGQFPMTRAQFFLFTFFVVSTMGVANEIVEYFAQTYANWIFALTVTDTWLDLVSNTLGALLAGAVLTPFIPHTKTAAR